MFTPQERKVLIIGILSLVVAVVTYGLLGSTGTIDNELGKFGGAITGFLAAATLLNKIYGSSKDSSKLAAGNTTGSVESDSSQTAQVPESHREDSVNPGSGEGTVEQFPNAEKLKSARDEIGGNVVTEAEKSTEVLPLLDRFFTAYDAGEGEIEEYSVQFSQILHRLAKELSEKDRNAVVELCAVMETYTREIERLKKEIRISPSRNTKEELMTLDRQVRLNIADFRHGEILRNYRERVI